LQDHEEQERFALAAILVDEEILAGNQHRLPSQEPLETSEPWDIYIPPVKLKNFFFKNH
jgi:hypothetical protein